MVCVVKNCTVGCSGVCRALIYWSLLSIQDLLYLRSMDQILMHRFYMVLQSPRLFESFPTVDDRARVRSFASMVHSMRFQSGRSHVTFSANVTLVGFLARVLPSVVLQISLRFEAFVAVLTFVRFFARVSSEMGFEVTFLAKFSVTDGAFIGFNAFVGVQVDFISVPLSKTFPASWIRAYNFLLLMVELHMTI